ncbi:hypothetical protein FCH28_19725 [Streptomyces piniterrae]|uniref:Ig-like domain-containing protein n=1 Tax=Streptomyces piniterrae TaxID=2571125 RepID=A0A4U0NDL9_9ACTN|nr:hypothetical protein [Streptomyces piniterrae]TJZ52070.1 hypothetical protein FCH28_19725 [Streptomyces piniterrae]
MKQRTRTDIGARVSTRTGTRALVAAGLAMAAVTTVGGCAFPGAPRVTPPPPSPTDTYSLGDPTGYPSDTYSPSPSPTEETFDPDGRSDVDGRNCDFSNSLRQFTYTVSVTNPSSVDSYSYDIAVNWMKAKPADGKAYGLHERSIVVGPGDTETYTAKYTVNQSSIGQFWYTCQITRAHKTRY